MVRRGGSSVFLSKQSNKQTMRAHTHTLAVGFPPSLLDFSFSLAFFFLRTGTGAGVSPEEAAALLEEACSVLQEASGFVQQMMHKKRVARHPMQLEMAQMLHGAQKHLARCLPFLDWKRR